MEGRLEEGTFGSESKHCHWRGGLVHLLLERGGV
jgi:hypothetical protein